MRRAAIVILVALLAGCGPSGPTPAPLATPTPMVAATVASPPIPTPSEARPTVLTGAGEIGPDNAANLGEIAHFGQGWVTALAWSPRGDLLAVGTVRGVRLYNPQSLPDTDLLATAAPVWCLAFSGDGALLAAGSWDGVVRLWDVPQKRLIQLLNVNERGVFSLAFSPQGTLLATASCGEQDGAGNCIAGEIRLWDVATAQQILALRGHADWVTGVAFAPDGATLASGAQDGTIRLWDVATSRERQLLLAPAEVRSVTFSRDGALVAAGLSDGTVYLWRTADGEPVTTLSGPLQDVKQVAFSPDGGLLLAAAGDGPLRIWESQSWQLVQLLVGHTGAVPGAAFSPDGRRIASCSWDGTVRVWEVATGQAVQTIAGHRGGIQGLALSPQGTTMALAVWDDSIRLLQTSTGREIYALYGHTASPRGLAYAANAPLLASGGDDAMVRLWDTSTGAPRAVLAGHTATVLAVAFSPDDRLLASGGWDQTIRLWDVATGEVLAVLTPQDTVHSLLFTPDGQTLLATAGGQVQWWSLHTYRPVRALTVSSQEATMAALSPDSQRLVVAAGDRVQMWDLATERQVWAQQGYLEALSVAYAPNGTVVATGWLDGSVVLFDAWDGRTLLGLPAHLREVTGVAFRPDGSRLFSVGWDGIVRVWGP